MYHMADVWSELQPIRFHCGRLWTVNCWCRHVLCWCRSRLTFKFHSMCYYLIAIYWEHSNSYPSLNIVRVVNLFHVTLEIYRLEALSPFCLDLFDVWEDQKIHVSHHPSAVKITIIVAFGAIELCMCKWQRIHCNIISFRVAHAEQVIGSTLEGSDDGVWQLGLMTQK
jgi:hypothetical protein